MRAVSAGIDGAFNAGQDETLTIDDFLKSIRARGVRVSSALLWERGLMPNCSHFSEPWMPALDNQLGKETLGLTYTPFSTYLEALIQDSEANPSPPPGYEQRARELDLVKTQTGTGPPPVDPDVLAQTRAPIETAGGRLPTPRPSKAKVWPVPR